MLAFRLVTSSATPSGLKCIMYDPVYEKNSVPKMKTLYIVIMKYFIERIKNKILSIFNNIMYKLFTRLQLEVQIYKITIRRLQWEELS